MESVYFFVPDNVSEIISIFYHNKIASHLSRSSKLYSNLIYNVPKLTLYNFHNKYDHDKYWKLKEICVRVHCVFLSRCFPSKDGEYFINFTRMSTINSLDILFSPKNCATICLTHFTNLTCLNFNASNCEEIICDYIKLKKICGSHYKNTQSSIFYHCTNVEYLNFGTCCNPKLFINENIYPKLTHLSANFNSDIIQSFHSNYFQNIVELFFNGGHIDFEKYKFPMLTSLTLLFVNQIQRLQNMSRLKSLKISSEKREDINIHLSDTYSLKNLHIIGFERLILMFKPSVYTKSVYFHDCISNLQTIEMKNCDRVHINCDKETMENLKSLKYITIAKQTDCNSIFTTYLKQDLFDMIRINEMKSNIVMDD